MTRLVPIARYVGSLEGEIARIHLAEAGIEGYLENAELITWLWYLSNAFGGVRVFVAAEDADAATAILDNRAMLQADTPWRTCIGCDEKLAGDWHLCWCCGTDSTGVHHNNSSSDAGSSLGLLARIDIVGYAGITLIATLMAVAPPFALLVALMLLLALLDYTPEPETTHEEPEPHLPEPIFLSNFAIGNEQSRRH